MKNGKMSLVRTRKSIHRLIQLVHGSNRQRSKVGYTLKMATLAELLINQPDLLAKVQKLEEDLYRLKRVAVALSGGVDSTLLLKITSNTLGQNCIALIGTSPSFPPQERQEAIELAQQMGVAYELIETSEMQDPAYVENSSDRCYHCRIHAMDDLLQRAKELGFEYLVDGANADDTADYRPGQEAAKELGVRSPLLDAGITKMEIRQIARLLKLPIWNKPSSACLASRIPYGTAITIDALNQINEAENSLKGLGFTNVRVRHYNDLARIELLAEEFERAIHIRQQITRSLKKIGYTYVTLDLDGFRSGSMNLVFLSDTGDGSR